MRRPPARSDSIESASGDADRLLSTRAVEKIGDVQDLNIGTGPAQASLDLKETAGIGCDDHLGAGAYNVVNLPPLQAFGHFRLGQIVGACAAAADIRLGQFDEAFSRNCLHEIPGLFRNALRVRQVTGIVIGNTKSEVRSPRSEGRTGVDQPLGQVFYLRAKPVATNFPLGLSA